MKFVVYNQWDQLPESANALFAQGEQASLFCSRAWLEVLANQALAEHQSIQLVCVLEAERVLAVLPMMTSPRDGLSALSNHYTTLYSLLITNNHQRDAINFCLVEGLSQIAPRVIQFEPIDDSDDNMTCLRQAMTSYGFESHTYFRFYNWSHPVNGQSFAEYMAERPANIRNMIERKQRKLEREHGYDIRLFQDVDIEQALIDYQMVYQASWKANELFAEFTPNLVKRAAGLGWLRLAILYIEQKPVAAQIWFVVNGKANIYRLAYDELWKNYSPGSILTQYLMRHVIDKDKVSEIDFLTGNERYKQDWMTMQNERIGVRFLKAVTQESTFSRMIRWMKSKR
ncbi:MAG: GNAT family N-acetyltransferase [Gammaproteobacteria bacterium]